MKPLQCGSIGYSTEQGLGYLMKDFYDHGVISKVLLVRHPRHPFKDDWYPKGTPEVNPRSITGLVVEEFLDGIDTLLLWESPFDWSILPLAAKHNTKTVLVPMYEWWPKRPPHLPDKFICPSLLDLDYFAGMVSEVCFLPVPVDSLNWLPRSKAFCFLHNAGHIGHREHKGTRQLLEALKHVKSHIQLTIRCQYPGMIEKMAESVGVLNDSRLTLVSKTVPRERLFGGFDVYVAPEKLNGCSLPLQEAFAHGLLVISTDRYPMNTWLPKEPLIPVKKTFWTNITPSYLDVEESVVDPVDIAAKIDEWHGKDIGEFSERGRQWAVENSWEQMTPKWVKELTP